jgi:hypothetical protein
MVADNPAPLESQLRPYEFHKSYEVFIAVINFAPSQKVALEQAPRYQPWSKHSSVWTGRNEASIGKSDTQRWKSIESLCVSPQRTGADTSLLKKDLTSIVIIVLFALNKFYQNFITFYKAL